MYKFKKEKFWLYYGHWVALVMSVFILGITFSSTSKDIKVAIKKLDEENGRMHKRMWPCYPVEHETIDIRKEIAARLKKTWEPGFRNYKKLSNSIAYPGPNFQYNREKPVWLYASQDLVIEAKLSKLKISWKKPISKRKKKLGEIDGYFLAKSWVTAKGKVNQLLDIGKNTSYVDQEVITEKNYTYSIYAYSYKNHMGTAELSVNNFDLRLTALNQEKAALYASPQEWLKKIYISFPSVSQTTMTSPVYKLQLLNVQGHECIVKLEKLIKGKWHSSVLRFREGDQIKRNYIHKKNQVTWDPQWQVQFIGTTKVSAPLVGMDICAACCNGIPHEKVVVPAIGIINRYGKKIAIAKNEVYPGK